MHHVSERTRHDGPDRTGGSLVTAEQNDGGIVLGGEFLNVDGENRSRIARIV